MTTKTMSWESEYKKIECHKCKKIIPFYSPYLLNLNGNNYCVDCVKDMTLKLIKENIKLKARLERKIATTQKKVKL